MPSTSNLNAHMPLLDRASSRRQFLQVGAIAAVTAAVAACSSDSSPSSTDRSTPAVADTTTNAAPTPSAAPAVTTTIAAAASPAVLAERTKPLQSLYVPMRDNVRIAIDVWLPEAATDAVVPTAIRATRYQRATQVESTAPEDNPNYVEARRWQDLGYAFVVVDARGSGASFGTRDAELATDEIVDYGEVVDWIATQPWSNGRVGSYGGSYDGDTAEHMARNGSKALTAIAPLFSDFDPYRQTVYPGGVYFEPFEQWLGFTTAMDGNFTRIEQLATEAGIDPATVLADFPRAAPVDGPDGMALLEEAIAEHQASKPQPLDAVEFRDDPRWEATAIAPHQAEIEASGVPIFVEVGWYDAGTVAGMLERFATFSNPMEVTVGPWRHGGTQSVDTTRATQPTFPGLTLDEQFGRLVDFFNRYVRDGETAAAGKTLTFSTFGTDGWQTTAEWPLPDVEDRVMYFSGNSLGDTPAAAVETVAIPTTPHTTGLGTRWLGQIGGGDIDYSAWGEGAASRQAFTSDILSEALTVCGFPVVTVDVSSPEADGVLIAYLEVVGPDDVASYITEGVIRLKHRGATQPTVRTDQRLDRSFAEADFAPMEPGTPSTVTFDMMPMSVEFPAGSRIRVSFATSDTDNLRSYSAPESALTLHSTPERPATLTLPIRG
jgi:uncharacterized protein